MGNHMAYEERRAPEVRKLLVAVDFSQCSRLALRTARGLLEQRPGQIIALHIIDEEFIEKCYGKTNWTTEEIAEHEKEFQSLKERHKELIQKMNERTKELLRKEKELKKIIKEYEKAKENK